MVGMASELFESRVCGGIGLKVTPSTLDLCPSQNQSSLLDNGKQMVRCLLPSDDNSAARPKGMIISVPFQRETGSIPLPRGNSLPGLLLSLVDNICKPWNHCRRHHHHPTDSPSPFVISEECILGLLGVCLHGELSPSCIKMVAVLCRASPRARSLFETSHLRDLCLSVAKGEGERCGLALSLLREYLEDQVSALGGGREECGDHGWSPGKAAKVVRKLLLGKCADKLSSPGPSAWSEEHQVSEVSFKIFLLLLLLLLLYPFSRVTDIPSRGSKFLL